MNIYKLIEYGGEWSWSVIVRQFGPTKIRTSKNKIDGPVLSTQTKIAEVCNVHGRSDNMSARVGSFRVVIIATNGIFSEFILFIHSVNGPLLIVCESRLMRMDLNENIDSDYFISDGQSIIIEII